MLSNFVDHSLKNIKQRIPSKIIIYVNANGKQKDFKQSNELGAKSSSIYRKLNLHFRLIWNYFVEA